MTPETSSVSTVVSRTKLTGLEAGRGIAALLVVLRHCGGHCLQAYGIFPLGGLFAFGHVGVDFFFVLSGFIIFYAHERDIGRPSQLLRYAERRVTRIYPAYWIILAFTLCAASMSSHTFPSVQSIFTSLFLLPTIELPIVGVAWTLQNEMLFYGIFAVLLLNKRLGFSLFAMWFVFLVSGVEERIVPELGVAQKLSSYFNFEFFLGMGAAWLTGRGVMIPAPRLLVFVGAIAFFMLGLAENAHLVMSLNAFTHLGFGLAATVMIVGLVAWERQRGLQVPKILAIMGSASYSIYLVHLLAIGTIWQVLLRFPGQYFLPVWAVYLLLAGGAVVGGVAVSYLIEKPLIALTRKPVVRATSVGPVGRQNEARQFEPGVAPPSVPALETGAGTASIGATEQTPHL